MPYNLYTTTSEAQARLVGFQGEEATPGYVLTRKWEFIDATVADTLVVALEAVTQYTNPQADGQTYTGTFANSVVESSADDKRQVTITQQLTLVAVIGTTDAIDDMPEPLVTRYTDEDINDLEFSDWEVPRQRLRLTWANIDPESIDNVVDQDNISKADWEAEAATYVSSGLTEDVASEWEYSALNWSHERNGTATVVVDYVDNDFNEDGTENAKQITTVRNEGGWGETQVDRIKGKAQSDAVNTFTAMSADTDKVITSKSWRDGQPGEAIIDKVQQVSEDYGGAVTPTPTITAPKVILKQLATGNLPATYVATWFRTDPAYVDHVEQQGLTDSNWETWFGTGITSANGFVYKKTDLRQNPDGTVDVTMTIWVPRTRSYTAPSTTNTYDLRRSWIEKVGKNPEPGSLSDEPAEGFWWRLCSEEKKCKWTASDTNAEDFADKGLNGSFSSYDKASGLFYAEQVTARTIGAWNAGALADEDAAVGTAGANAGWVPS